MERSNPLGEERIPKLLIKFSIPAIVGMMVNALYNVVDRIYIGNSADLGQNGLAGVTVAMPLMFVALAIGVLFGIGGATLFSIKLGQKEPEYAQKALGNAFFLLIVTSILYSILLQLFLTPLLSSLGASDATLPYAREYMRVILFGSVFQITGMGINNFMRADGSPRLAMMTMLLGAGVNIVLDPIFIFGFKMGMTGAALATVLSQGLSFIWVIIYFTGKRSKIKLKVKHMLPDGKTTMRIFSLGMPGFLLQLAGSVLNSALNRNMLLYGGDIAVSGMGIINSLLMILFMPIIGLNQGIQPIISFNYGAKKYDRVRHITTLAIVIATAISVFGFLMTRLIPGPMIAMFNREPALTAFTSEALKTWLLMMPLIGFQIIAANYFQAIGKPKTAMFLTLTRQVIILMPAILLFPRFWGMNGLLYAAPFADLGSSLLTGIWFLFGIRELRRLHASESVECESSSRKELSV